MNLLDNKFKCVYERNVDRVYKICYVYVKNISDAEDLTQNIFIKYLKKERFFESLEHEKAWFIKVSTNTCKNHFKSWHYKNIFLNDKHEIIHNDYKDETLNYVLSLPTKYKQIVYMFYYEGYTTKEISNILSINESTIRTQLSKARELLKKQLGCEL